MLHYTSQWAIPTLSVVFFHIIPLLLCSRMGTGAALTALGQATGDVTQGCTGQQVLGSYQGEDSSPFPLKKFCTCFLRPCVLWPHLQCQGTHIYGETTVSWWDAFGEAVTGAVEQGSHVFKPVLFSIWLINLTFHTVNERFYFNKAGRGMR